MYVWATALIKFSLTKALALQTHSSPKLMVVGMQLYSTVIVLGGQLELVFVITVHSVRVNVVHTLYVCALAKPTFIMSTQCICK